MVAAAGFAAAAAMVGALADCGTRVQARLAAPTVPRSGTMRVAFVSCCQIGRQECRLLRYHRAPLLQHHLRGRSARRRCCRCVLISAARPARSLPNRTEGASRPAARSAQQAAVARACGQGPNTWMALDASTNHDSRMARHAQVAWQCQHVRSSGGGCKQAGPRCQRHCVLSRHWLSDCVTSFYFLTDPY